MTRDRRADFLELLFGEVEKAESTLVMVSHDPTLAKYFDVTKHLGDFAQVGRRGGAMIIVRLAVKSLCARWLTGALTVLAIGLSVMLVVGVEKIRSGARQSFVDTISGAPIWWLGRAVVDLQLLLYSVFRIGNATNNVTWADLPKDCTHDLRWSGSCRFRLAIVIGATGWLGRVARLFQTLQVPARAIAGVCGGRCV